MNGSDWWQIFFQSDYGQAAGGLQTAVFVLVLSFVIGQLVGWIYMWTHSGLSYSQSYVASLAILPVILALMMLIMAGSVVIAFGLLAVFAVVRFRNVLKDTRDTTFILWAILEGLAVGTMRYTTAVIAALGVSIVIVYLHLISYGRRHRYDAVLSLELNGDLQTIQESLKELLYCYCDRLLLASQQQLSTDSMHMSYRVLLRDPNRCNELREKLQQKNGIEDVNLFLCQDEAEI
ncbi:MAG TPA: DUF4956 domain-containing protein [Thermoguttaceae bacterium]